MASDFGYLGIENHMHVFKEHSTGMRYTVTTRYDDETVTLHDGDVIELGHPQLGSCRYSIRENRRI